MQSVIARACQSVAPLDHTDPTFTSRPPLLSLLEPALLFQFLPFCAARAAIRNRNIFHAQEPGPLLVRLRIKTRIPCNRLRHPTQSALLLGNRRQQQSLIGGAVLKTFVNGVELVFCFFHSRHPPPTVWLSLLSLAHR